MTNVLVTYASTNGHTAKISRRIADVLQSDDLDVDLRDLGADDSPDPQHAATRDADFMDAWRGSPVARALFAARELGEHAASRVRGRPPVPQPPRGTSRRSS
jgi:hypothetical protein